MSDAPFSKLVPGFDFLQNLVKNAGSALPGIGQWVAPTLDPKEIEKRIEELRTVQFWLEQNARMLGATIQALEVQRMTLSTLQTMNVQMTDLGDAMKLRMPEAPAAPRSGFMSGSTPAPAAASAGAARGDEEAAAPASPMGIVDPMQWWGALTKQFTELATGALKDAGTSNAGNLAGTMVQQSIQAAEQALKNAVGAPAPAAAGAERAAPARRAPSAAKKAAPARKSAARKKA